MPALPLEARTLRGWPLISKLLRGMVPSLALIFIVLGTIYLLAVFVLELVVMPLYVYRPIRTVLNADAVDKAIAAAMFGDAETVKFTPTTAQQRFVALQSGEVDLLVRTTTYTLTRDTALGFDFTGVNYYDGQGFMVNKKLGVKSAKELNGATVCVQPGTTTELNLADYFRANKMTFKPVVIEKVDEIRAAFFSGRCDVYTTDASSLAATRADFGNHGQDDVFRGHTWAQLSFDVYGHGFEWLERQGLCRENMFNLARANAHGERTEGTVG